MLVPKATLKVTTNSNTLSPSAARTETTRSLSPATSSSLPAISTVASESEASATTSTEVVPASSSTTSPETTSVPFTWNTDNETSTLASLFKVIVNVLTVSPSAAVTVTTSSLAPTTSPSFPEISIVASGSDA